ncbi:MAG: hypothetical protein LUD68_10765 [Rikenellaceae bacterium]|nr:hypothetical protein [Rikenellaceae bacterium]
MTRTFIFLVIYLGALSLTAQPGRPEIKVGGTFFLYGFSDSYRSVESRDGLYSFYPLAPRPDPNGKDLHRAGQFGMSVYATRLHVELTEFTVLDAQARLHIEIDFMGTGNDVLQLLRLRHAYLYLQGDRQE